MALFTWKEDMSVCNKKIDRQHLKLVNLINELHSAMLQGKGQHILAHIMSGLTEYTDEHFLTEEQHFERFDYPDRQNHIAEHASFVQKLNEFKQAMLEGRQQVTIEMIDFLSDWLSHHILETDKQYEVFFQEQGIW